MSTNYIDEPIPALDSTAMELVKREYPNIPRLEAGNVSQWLSVRREDLLEKARTDRNGMNVAKTITFGGTALGLLFYATSPLGIAGALVSAVGYAWTVLDDMLVSHKFCPLPFVRGDFFEFVQSLGDADDRAAMLASQNELSDLMSQLEPFERKEFAFLSAHLHTLTDYLTQVETGKRFYAYRWLLLWFIQLQGEMPSVDAMHNHVDLVEIDSTINYKQVNAIKAHSQSALQLVAAQPQGIPGLDYEYKGVDLPTSTGVNVLSGARTIQDNVAQNNVAQDNSTQELSNQPTRIQATGNEDLSKTKVKAHKLIEKLEADGLAIRKILGSQIIGLVGTQRGGKGTMAGLCMILNLAVDPSQQVEYFTSGVDIYPFKCRLHCAHSYPDLEIQEADRKVARDLLAFLKKMANSEPYSQSGLILVIDECLTLLSYLEPKDKAWAIKYLLSNAAKSGALIILVLHANNLTAIAGDETSGLAATFQGSVHFVGCKAQSVPMQNNPMRSINVASGEYFLADVKNFGKAIEDGELGRVPGWLKKATHPLNGQPDPVRSLLGFFTEFHDENLNSVVKGGFSMDEWDGIEDDLEYTHERVLTPQRPAISKVVESTPKVIVDSTSPKFDSNVDQSQNEQFIVAAVDVILEHVEAENITSIAIGKIRNLYGFKKSNMIGRAPKSTEVSALVDYIVSCQYGEKRGDAIHFEN